MAFHPMEIEAFTEQAQRAVREVDVRGFIETYAAYPELAGRQMMELVGSLPKAPESKSKAKVNAFFGLEILEHTRRQVEEILREDEYMQAMLDEVHLDKVDITESLKGDDGFGTQAFRDYLKSETAGDQEGIDKAIRRETGNADDAVHRSFQDAMLGDAKRAPKKYDYSRLSPAESFRRSTADMGVLIVKNAVFYGRMQPIIRERHKTAEEIEHLCGMIQFRIAQLRYEDGGMQNYED